MQSESNEIVAAVANPLTPYDEQSAAEPEVYTAGPSDSTDNILVRLNEDCIIRVFEWLPLSDLCTVADVCRGFEMNALSVFRRRYSHLDLDELVDESYSGDDSEFHMDDSFSSIDSYKSESKHAWDKKHMRYKPSDEARSVGRFYNMETVESLFRHFGAHIETIDLTATDENQNDQILELMAIFCTNEDAKLTKLIMNGFTIEPDLIPRIQCLFDRLTILDITRGSIAPFHGPELAELVLDDVILGDGIGESNFEKLHTLTLLDINEIWSRRNFKWTSLHQLKRLSIAYKLYRFTDDFSFPIQLEELELDGPLEANVIEEMRQLRNLKALTVRPFDCSDRWMTALLNMLVEEDVPIEELCLKNFTLSVNTTTSLAKLSKIKKLSLIIDGWQEQEDNVKLSNVIQGMPILEKLHLREFGCVDIDVIKSIIENAPKLNQFIANVYERELNIRTSDYNEICQFVRKRLDTTKLTLELSGIDVKLSVPENIIERNRLWLEVTLITFQNVQPVDIIDYYGFSDDSVTESSDESD